MKEFLIGINDANQRLDKFVQKAAPHLPQPLLYKYIRLKRIKVNAKRSEIAYRLLEGDKVEMYINDEFFTEDGPADAKDAFLYAPKTLHVIYEDPNILLVDKKPGLVVHEDDEGTKDTLIARIQHYLFDKGEYDPARENTFAPALCNRIDRNTGGIVMAAKNAQALRAANEKIRAREIRKFYLCVVLGTLEAKSGILEGFLEKDSEENKVYIHAEKRAGDRSIRTRYRVISEKTGLSLVEVELLTGRTHQIRAHFASIGHPLLGDGKYGSNAVNKKYGMKYQALYSYKLSFDFQSGADAGADALDYLKGRTFEVEDVWFAREFFADGLRRK